jgi:hypothetical protein
MKFNEEQITKALKNEGDKLSMGNIPVDRIQLYAALGFMAATGEKEVSFNEKTGCPCVPGSSCYPECADSE